MLRWLVLSVVVLGLSACANNGASSASSTNTMSKAGTERLNAAWGYMQSQNYQRAKHHLDRAVEHDPKGAKIYAALGHYYGMVGEKKLADESFETAVRLDKYDGDSLNLYGVYLCREGKYAAAEDIFERVLNLRSYSNMSATLENAGLCALKVKNTQKAEQYFQRAVRHNPQQAASLLELGYIEFQKNSAVKAKAFLDRYVATSSDTARSLLLGIQIANALGDKDTLASWGLKLERLFPESEEASTYEKFKKQWRK